MSKERSKAGTKKEVTNAIAIVLAPSYIDLAIALAIALEAIPTLIRSPEAMDEFN